jgi:hypothetical protein
MPSDEARFDARLELREKRPGGQPLAPLAMTLLVAMYAGRGSPTTSLAIFAIGGLLVFLARAVFATRAPQVIAHVRIDDERVHVSTVDRRGNSAARSIPKGEIASGFFRPGVGAHRGAVILRDGRDKDLLEVVVDDEEQAVSLLAALDLDAAKRLFPMDLAPPLSALGRGGVGLLALALGGLGAASLYAGVSPMFAVVAAALALLVGAWPARAEIAPDGVSITWLTRRRFVPFADLSTVTETTKGAVLHLVSGERVVLPRALGESGNGAIVARVREAFDVYRAAAPMAPAAAVALVSRGEREVSAWLDDLRGMRAEGYRTASVRDDDLWRVLEDPSAAGDARAGAALLLRSRLDDAGRARIRIASAATASPKLRVALDATVDAADDDHVEEHLASLARER